MPGWSASQGKSGAFLKKGGKGGKRMVKKYKSVLLSLLFVPPVAASVSASQDVQVNDMIIVARNDVIAAASPVSQDMPLGQGADAQPSLLPEDSAGTGDVFGIRGGYLHPYLSISEEYSDNLFNVNVDEKENWLTTISPGLWLSLPRTKEVPITITPHNTSPGGLQLALHDFEGFDRYHFYLLGGLDIKFYSEDSDLNDTNAKAEGMFQYNLRSGLTLQVVDRYTYGQDRFDAGSSTANGVRRYNSNIFQGTADWDFSEKFRAKLDYANFLLDYNDVRDSFLDRTDNSLSAYAIYKYSPKTDFFVEYRFVDVSYDQNTAELKDNTNNFIYAGVNWDTTEKTSLRLKVGYQDKNYSDDTVDNANGNPDGFALEGELKYQFTVKTNMALRLSHKIDETDSSVALNKKVFAASFFYNQQFAERWKGVCYIGFENADYDQIIPVERNEDRFVFSPAIEYFFRDWLMGELKYTYDTRNSTDDFFDYSTNRIMLSLNFAL